MLLWPLPTRRKETVLLFLKDTVRLDRDSILVFILLLVHPWESVSKHSHTGGLHKLSYMN